MAGQPRKHSIEKERCAGLLRDGTRCKSIPITNWKFCPWCHDREAKRQADEWAEALQAHATNVAAIEVVVPTTKPLEEFNREERAALGLLITRQAAA